MRTRRLFFALWPTDQIRCSIEDILCSLSLPENGRIIRPENFHITLHFIGSVTEEVKDCMHASAQVIQLPAFDYQLDYFGHFMKAKIFWMSGRGLPAELLQLQQDLGGALGRCGYQCEKRHFMPHVSLMRKSVLPVSDQVEFSIPWRVEDFVLVESIAEPSGMNYQVIERYPLF